MNFSSFKRFVGGAAVGLFVAIIFWFNAAYFDMSVSLAQGFTGCILLAICCGIVGQFGNIDRLIDDLNLPF